MRVIPPPIQSMDHTRDFRVLDLFKPWRVFRSVVSGRRVTRLYALAHQYTTVSERRWAGIGDYLRRRRR